jgi:hypothetical protein
MSLLKESSLFATGRDYRKIEWATRLELALILGGSLDSLNREKFGGLLARFEL